MLNEDEKLRIEYLESYGWENMDFWREEISTSTNPHFLKEMAETYPWGDGLDFPNLIAEHPSCDLGTALCLFWLAGTMEYYLGELERNEHNSDWADFCEKVIEKILNDHYQPGPVSFDPGVNRVWAYKYQKLGVPPIFYQPVNGIKSE